jgi:hypothetical protein
MDTACPSTCISMIKETRRIWRTRTGLRMRAKIKAHTVDHTPSVTAPTVVVDIIRDAIRSVTGTGARP